MQISIRSACLAFILATGPSCAKGSQPSTATSTKPAASGASVQAAPDSEPLAKTVHGVTVSEAVACRSVEDRAPVGSAEKFPSDVGRVVVYNALSIAEAGQTSIQHVWFYEGRQMATVTLPIQTPKWRTYSSKKIGTGSKGNWRVDITTKDNQLLRSVSFQIE